MNDRLRGRKTLVTGGAGFIGSHLVRGLLDAGAVVAVIDDLSGGHRANLPDAGIEWHEASILDDAALRAATAGCAAVFHLAAIVSVPLSVEDPVRCLEVNTIGTERVLLAARDANVRCVVQASSAAVYGDPVSLPSREADRPDCCSPYAASKAAAEGLGAAFARCYGLGVASLRFFNIFGPRQDPKSPYAAVIAAFIDALSAGRRPTVHGDGRQTRDFTYVDNVVQACLLAASAPDPPAGDVLNVGTGRRTSLLDLLDELGRVLDVEPEPVFEAARAGDVEHSVADITRAQDRLGYAPAVGLGEGLERTVTARCRT